MGFPINYPITELPLGVIREQGEWTWRPKGAREQGTPNLGEGSTKIWKGEQGTAKNWEMEQGAREIIRGARGKSKKEQRATTKEQ